jgi:hypothetical protein
MRKLALSLVLGFSAIFGYAQTPEQFAKNAEAFAAQASSAMIVVRQTFQKDAWTKVQARLASAKWDVKKTDSLLTPTIAIVVIELQSGVSGRYASTEEAEAASGIPWTFLERVELEYVPTSTGWAINKGRTFHHDLKQWLPAKEHPDPTMFTPIGWAIKGFAIAK